MMLASPEHADKSWCCGSAGLPHRSARLASALSSWGLCHPSGRYRVSAGLFGRRTERSTGRIPARFYYHSSNILSPLPYSVLTDELEESRCRRFLSSIRCACGLMS